MDSRYKCETNTVARHLAQGINNTTVLVSDCTQGMVHTSSTQVLTCMSYMSNTIPREGLAEHHVTQSSPNFLLH